MDQNGPTARPATPPSQSKNHPPSHQFYDQVDKYRYGTNWGCLIWIFLILAVAAGIVWWFWQRR